GKTERLAFDLGAALPARAAQDRLYPRDQLARAERLDDVVISPELEADNPVGLLAASRQHDDRYLALSAKDAAHFQAIYPRQHQAEHDEIRGPAPSKGERPLAVGGGCHFEAVTHEVTFHYLGDHRLVVDYKNAVSGHELRCDCGPNHTVFLHPPAEAS